VRSHVRSWTQARSRLAAKPFRVPSATSKLLGRGDTEDSWMLKHDLLRVDGADVTAGGLDR
jgi:hypothetical protein